MGTVIAERGFVHSRKGHPKAKLRVRIGCPVRSAAAKPRDPWWCRIEMTGRGLTCVAGEDSLQSLVLALHFAAERLPIDASERNGRVEWLGQTEKLIFARAFVTAGLEGAILSLIGGIFRSVALSDRPAAVRREGERVKQSLRALAKEVGL